MKAKKTHGGKRKGAGRPVTKEETVVMRVPKSKVKLVKKIIAKPLTRDQIDELMWQLDEK